MKKRYYLKATGSVCYDASGITFPRRIPIDIDALAKIFFNSSTTWQHAHGWKNQPKALCFECDEATAHLFDKVMNAFYGGFIVEERGNW